jgi:predicted MarR family transcription regulator
MAVVTTVPELLDGHVVLDVQCLDRIYLNGYVPNLQVGGQVSNFMRNHLGYDIPSPAVLERIGTAFRRSVSAFAEDEHVPVVHFGKDDRKIDLMRQHMARQAATGRSGVAAIGVAQELQNVFASSKRQDGNAVWFSFYKADRRVTCFYFYLWDDQFGPAFIKVCAYFPYPIKVWINGHEWAKRQCTRAGIRFTALSNGFATASDPAAVQAICDRLGPEQIQAFADYWLERLPLPLTVADQAAGYWWELSLRQVETSRTIVFDAPRHARAFVEALVADNLDLGRPDNVELIFTGRRPGYRGRPIKHDVCKTSVITRDTQVSVNAYFKHSRIKQYLKDGRALRIETVINSTQDLGCQRRLSNLTELQARARAANARLLDTERVGQGCVLASPAFERVALTSVTAEGRRAPALRFGDPRVMALVGALCLTLNAVLGFTNRSLRAQVSQLLGQDYGINQISYDLGRLRLNGLIERLDATNRYRLTADGQRVAIFYTKVHQRLLRPLLAADTPPAPPELRQALATIDHHVTGYITAARLGNAARNSRSTSKIHQPSFASA